MNLVYNCGVLDYSSWSHHILGSYSLFIVLELAEPCDYLIFFAIPGEGKNVIRGESSRIIAQG